jgi:hypothetical protein
VPSSQPDWPIGVPQPPERWSWQHFWDVWITTTVQGVDIGWLNKLVENVAPHVFAVILGTALRTRATTAQVLGKALGEVEEQANPILLDMAAAGLSDYFERPITAAQIGGPGNRTGRAGLVDELAGAVLTSIFGALDSAGPITPTAGAHNAARVIGYNISTALEGWLEGLLGPGFLHEWIPTFGELDDVISTNLGLGRLARRVLSPLMDTLIVRPYTQYLNSIYRPAVYSESQAVRALNRGQLAESEYFDLMGRQGWDQEKAAELRVILGPLPSPDDIRGLYELDMIDAPTAKGMLQAIGHPPAMAQLLFTLMKQDRIRSLRTEAVSLARTMYANRELTEAELTAALATDGLSALEIDTVKALGAMQRSRPTRLARSTMEDGFQADLVDVGELTAYYELEGYPQREREILIGLAVRKKADALKAKQVRAAAAAARLHKPLSQAAAQELHRRGIITSTQLAVYLTALGFVGDPLAQLVALADQRRRDFLLALARAGLTPAPDLPPRSAVEDSYVRGLVDAGTLRGYYGAAGYDGDAIVLLMRLADARRNDYLASIAGAAARATEAEKREAERVAKAAAAEEARKAADEARQNRPLPQAQAVELYRLGLIDRGKLQDLLGVLGIHGEPAQLALALADQRRQAYVTAQAKAAAAAAPTDAPRSAEEEGFVRDLVDEDTLRAFYAGQGYDVEAVALLLELARQQRDEYQAKLAATAAAPARADVKGRN